MGYLKNIAILPDDVWRVVQTYYDDYLNLPLDDAAKLKIESVCEIHSFNGGVFISKDGEFDLFVLPEWRGKWKIRTILGEFLGMMTTRYGKAVATIHPCNIRSLRLAKGFGFNQTDIGENDMLILEKV